MIKRYITDQNIIHEADEFQPGVWVALTSPTAEECTLVADTYGIDPADVRAALDDEESSRVDVSNDYSLILFDIPTIEYRHKREAYTTIPLGLILTGETLITVCGEETPVLKAFTDNLVM